MVWYATTIFYIQHPDLEARRAPVDKLDRALRLDRRNRSVDVLRDDVASVHHTARHVLSVYSAHLFPTPSRAARGA